MTTRVLHLIGGQVLVGEFLMNEHGQITLIHPYEVFVAPNASSLKTTIALIKFGSLSGVLPQLAPDFLSLMPVQILATLLVPPDLERAYGDARSRSAEEQMKIQETLASSTTDISKGGTL